MSVRFYALTAVALTLCSVTGAEARTSRHGTALHGSRAHVAHVRTPARREAPATLAPLSRREPLIVLQDRSGVDTKFKARQGQFYGNENYYSDARNWGF
jgi:hypothetical protein